VADVIQYATLQRPDVQERIAKRKKSSGEATKVAGKRKSSDRAGGSGRSSSKASVTLDERTAARLLDVCENHG
jgi:hypothetical protein